MGDITADFSRSEFKCKCGCSRDNISLDLVDRLQRLRNSYHSPIIINSGCRCIKHNKEVGGVDSSAHVCEGKDGEAADIKIHSASELYTLLSIIFFMSLFQRVGIGRTLLHVDVSATLPRPAIWPYGDK